MNQLTPKALCTIEICLETGVLAYVSRNFLVLPLYFQGECQPSAYEPVNRGKQSGRWKDVDAPIGSQHEQMIQKRCDRR